MSLNLAKELEQKGENVGDALAIVVSTPHLRQAARQSSCLLNYGYTLNQAIEVLCDLVSHNPHLRQMPKEERDYEIVRHAHGYLDIILGRKRFWKDYEILTKNYLNSVH